MYGIFVNIPNWINEGGATVIFPEFRYIQN